MGVVVLHGDIGRSSRRRAGRQILGMLVVGDDFGRRRRRGHSSDRRPAGRAVRREMLEVADVVAGHHLVPSSTANVLFSSAPTASTGRCFKRTAAEGTRRVARDRRNACSAAPPPCDDRVVAADGDRPVVAPADRRRSARAGRPPRGPRGRSARRCGCRWSSHRPAVAASTRCGAALRQHQAEREEGGRDPVGHRRRPGAGARGRSGRRNRREARSRRRH